MARRTKEEALATRNLLLDAAERVFHRNGVSHTTLADIAKEAGLTRGAIYWHFKNKVDLFQAMMDRVLLPMEQPKHAQDNLTDPLGHVRDCALAVLKSVASDPQSQRVFDIVCHKVEYVDDMMPLRERHIECRADFLKQLERGFRQAAKQGLITKEVTPRHAAVGLHALIDGLIMNWVLDPGYFPLAKSAESMVGRYLDALKAAPSRPASSTARSPRKRS